MPASEPSIELRNGTILRLGEVPERCDSVLIVLFHGTRLVLVENPKRGLEMPGGHTEAGESVMDTAARESFEEAGAVIDDIMTIGQYTLADGHVTTVVTATARELRALDPRFETDRVHLVDRLPVGRLSFDDGLYERVLLHLNWPADEQGV